MKLSLKVRGRRCFPIRTTELNAQRLLRRIRQSSYGTVVFCFEDPRPPRVELKEAHA